MSLVRIKQAGILWFVLALSLVAAFPGAALAASNTDAANSALNWMKTQQQADGSFTGFGAGSTVDALLAIEAANQDPMSFSSGGKTPVDFLTSKLSDLTKTPGSAGKLLIAVSALPVRFSGTPTIVSAINASYAKDGHYGKDVIGQAFSILGLKAAGETVPAEAVKWLQNAQLADGGWSFSGDTAAGAADTNTTAVAVQALVAGGLAATDPTLQNAKAYLATQVNADNGYAYQKADPQNNESDVNSTAYVVQALTALGEDTTKADAFMVSIQKSNGAFQWKKSEPDDNAGATYQAIPALLGATLIVGPHAYPGAAGSTGSTGGTVAGNPGTPGMPSTGREDSMLPLAAALLFSVMLVGTGLTLRLRRTN